MSVTDRNVIDFGHEDVDKVTVCISDHIPWDVDILRAHLETLQDKINDYLDYIDSGQIYEDFGGKGKTPNIKVIFCHKPTTDAIRYIDIIKETILADNCSFDGYTDLFECRATPCVRLSADCVNGRWLPRRDLLRGAPRFFRSAPSFSAWQAVSCSRAEVSLFPHCVGVPLPRSR